MLELHNDIWQLNWPSMQQVVAITQPEDSTTAQYYSYEQWSAAVLNCYTSVTQQPGNTVLLHQPDGLAFSIWFIALAMAGKHIVLAPDAQPTTLALAMQYCDWQAPHQLQESQSSTTPTCLTITLPAHAQVSFFTSGSTNQPKLITKTLTQLLREVTTLEQEFGAKLSSTALAAGTVSMQHIYGLLFRLLWPLCQNRPFYAQQLSYLEQWQALLQQHQVLFIASPAHLARFDDLPLLANDTAHIAAIFSSGGPLADDVPAHYMQVLGQAPIEVFGSTETGGIAYRQRSQAYSYWQAFNGITLTQDERGALHVTSPHLSAEQPSFQTEDRVQLHANGSFILLGRLDRIVKLEEKRLSLPELEQYCLDSELVAEVSALLLDKPKKQLVLAVVLSAAGNALLQQGKLAVNQQLKRHLLQRFERVMLPKRFRYIAALPYNAQGKLPRAQLEALFQHE